jgi:hypothetical protein
MQITITNGLFQGIINPVKNNTLWKDRQYGGSPMDLRHISRMVVISSLLLFTVSLAITLADPRERKYSGKELDELMAKVWQKCITDLENLRGYSFSETETMDYQHCYSWCPPCSKKIRMDYLWTLVDGYLVPTLKQFNGKEVSAEELAIMDPKELLQERKEVSRTNAEFCNMVCNSIVPIRSWFYDRQNHPLLYILTNILDLFDEFAQGHSKNRFFPPFKYEPGRYKYAGIKQFEGHKVIEVKYKPKSGMGSTVRMLIIPEENQLVRITRVWTSSYKFEHSMIMDRHQDEWLPKEFYEYVTSDSGSMRRSRNFHDYIKTGVKAKFWFEDVKVKIWYNTDKPQPKQ